MEQVKCKTCGHVNTKKRNTCAQCGALLPRPRTRKGSEPDRRRESRGGRRPRRFKTNDVVARRYTVIDIIGQGGMGCIYKVQDRALNEVVALKTLLPQFMRDKVLVERFFNEARIARHLSHPNIIRVHDIGVADKTIYISMEYVEGESLGARVNALAPGKRLPVAEVLDIMDSLCAALDYAHDHTIHRDIKPENIMLARDGTVKLMDFGISKLMSNPSMTSTSLIMGTPRYMSPEQLRDSSRVDARADIFSVGVVLYELLAGTAFTGVAKPASEIIKDIPPALDPIVAKCMEAAPDDRYQSAAELREALRPIRELIASRGARPGAETAMSRADGQGRLQRPLGIVLAATVVALAAGGIYGLEARRRAAAEETAAVMFAQVDVPDAFDRAAALYEDIRAFDPRAVAGDDEVMRAAVTRGERQWEAAKAAYHKGRPKAEEIAATALICLATPLLCPKGMVFVPPGPVKLGDGGRRGGPVELEGFFIDEKEVTNAQYQHFCRVVEGGWRLPEKKGLAEQPVAGVTYFDAWAYASWAGLRLPTEAQWARAAHGVTPRPYPWPEADYRPGAANVHEDGDPELDNVATNLKDRSEFGCYDMLGSVLEWTSSDSRSLPYNPADGREDEQTFDFGTPIVVRGGNYRAPPEECRLDVRYRVSFEKALPVLGFRCVRQLPKTLDALERELGLR